MTVFLLSVISGRETGQNRNRPTIRQSRWRALRGRVGAGWWSLCREAARCCHSPNYSPSLTPRGQPMEGERNRALWSTQPHVLARDGALRWSVPHVSYLAHVYSQNSTADLDMLKMWTWGPCPAEGTDGRHVPGPRTQLGIHQRPGLGSAGRPDALTAP